MHGTSSEVNTRYTLFATNQQFPQRRKPAPQSTYIVTLPPNTPWTWSILTTFHLANKRLVLPGKTTVVLRTTTDSSTEYTVTQITPPTPKSTTATTSTPTVVASGRVNVFKWVGMTTSWYGRKRGTWWLNNVDVKEDLWIPPGPSAVPTAMVMLQAGLRKGKREFVAMENITMADSLVFALTHRVFSAAVNDVDQVVFPFDQIPMVVHWFCRMQSRLLPSLLHTTHSDISVQCLKALRVKHCLPAGCMQLNVIPKCISISKRLQSEAAAAALAIKTSVVPPPRQWDKGGGQNRTSKAKAKRTQRALVEVQKKLEQAELFSLCVPCSLDVTKVGQCCDFQTLPISVDPASMMSGKDQRGRDASVKIGRKRNQVLSMLHLLLPRVQDGDTAVEFAAGSGYIGLVLAALRPKVRVILMDQNPVSMQYARARALKANLTNVECVVGDIRDFNVENGYAIGFALHACGAASDYVLDHCIRNGAEYVIAPCCAGFMQNTIQAADETVDVVPTSQKIREAGVTRDEYISLTSGADHSNHPEQAQSGRRAMAMLDLDRNLRAEESQVGYVTKYYRMAPEDCTPKNQILVGFVEKGGDGSDGSSGGGLKVAGEKVAGKIDEEVAENSSTKETVLREEEVVVVEEKVIQVTTTTEKKKKKKGGCYIS